MFALFRFAPVISAYTVECVSRFLFAIIEYPYQQGARRINRIKGFDQRNEEHFCPQYRTLQVP